MQGQGAMPRRSSNVSISAGLAEGASVAGAGGHQHGFEHPQMDFGGQALLRQVDDVARAFGLIGCRKVAAIQPRRPGARGRGPPAS